MTITPIEIPDATLEPEAYKQALLDLIGDKDPLDIIGQTAPAVRRLCTPVAENLLHAEPMPGEWAAASVVAHLYDVDLVYGFRWRLVLTEENPVYPGYNEKAWTPLARLPFWSMLAAWEGLRGSNLVLLRATDRTDWARTGVHGEQGPETFDEMVRKLAAHDLAHVNQIERALIAVTEDSEKLAR